MTNVFAKSANICIESYKMDSNDDYLNFGSIRGYPVPLIHDETIHCSGMSFNFYFNASIFSSNQANDTLL